MNRFERCKSLKDLYAVFTTEERVQSFDNLSDDELERVALVFEANIPDLVCMPDVPLTKAGYNYIWNVIVEEIETEPINNDENMEDEVMVKPNNVENVTMKDLFEAALKETMEAPKKAKALVVNTAKSFEQAAYNVKVKLGEEKEAFIDKSDEATTKIVELAVPLLNSLDDLLGCSALKERLCRIIYKNKDAKNKNDFFAMAKECREVIEEQIEIFKSIDPDDKLGTIAALKVYVDEVGEDGTVTGKIVSSKQSIWSAFANAIVWVCKKVTKLVKKWCDTNPETNVFGAIGASIAGVFATVGSVVKNAAIVAGNFLSFVGSYVVAGVIKCVDLIITAFKWVVSKIKSWTTIGKQKITKEDAMFDNIIENDNVIHAVE
jgi:hypothetical protein